jgi:DNA-binding XRE family transcriptional regulator
MNVQIIRKDGRPEWAIIPYEDYENLLAALEDKADAVTIAEIMGRIQSSEEETIPSAVVERLLTENPYRVWREYRSFTLQEVADAAGVSRAYISMLENGDRDNPSKDVLGAIAKKLAIDPDDLG